MELMTKNQVAEFLNVNPKTFSNWLSSGIIPRDEVSFRIPGSGKLLFVKEDILIWLAKIREDQKKPVKKEKNRLKIAK